MPNRFDAISIAKATVTPEGWIRDKPPLTRTGIFTYRKPDGTVRREYRPPEEVFSPESLSSLRGVPITDNHRGVIHADNSTGIIGTVLTEGERQDESVVAEIVIHNTRVLGPRRELSLGYKLELDETPGEVNGQRYDAVQRKIRINHLAVVERGRAGIARLRLDSADAVNGDDFTEDSMADDTKPKGAVVRIDGLEYPAAPEVEVLVRKQAAKITELEEKVTATTRRADTAEAERDSAKSQAAEAESKIAKAREDAVETVRARLELEAEAKAQGVEVRADESDRTIRVKVVEKIKPGEFKFDGKSDDYVTAIFDVELNRSKKVKEAAGQQRQQATGASGNGGNRQDSTTGGSNGTRQSNTKQGGANAARLDMLRDLKRPFGAAQ